MYSVSLYRESICFVYHPAMHYESKGVLNWLMATMVWRSCSIAAHSKSQVRLTWDGSSLRFFSKLATFLSWSFMYLIEPLTYLSSHLLSHQETETDPRIRLSIASFRNQERAGSQISECARSLNLWPASLTARDRCQKSIEICQPSHPDGNHRCQKGR